MTKDVLISISGLQFAGGENSEPVEVITSGSYYKKNGRHYILYDEVAEDTAGTTKNIIKLGDEVLDITKRGETNVHMMFEKDKKNVTYYYTPYGNLLIGIDATKVQVEETEHNLSVKVDYALEVNYEHMADCKITMNIQSKNAGDGKFCLFFFQLCIGLLGFFLHSRAETLLALRLLKRSSDAGYLRDVDAAHGRFDFLLQRNQIIDCLVCDQ